MKDDGAPDVFRYLNSSADNVFGLCSDSPAPSPCATPQASDPLTDTDRNAVTSVEVTLRVGAREKSSKGATTLRTRVAIQNAGLTATYN